MQSAARGSSIYRPVNWFLVGESGGPFNFKSAKASPRPSRGDANWRQAARARRWCYKGSDYRVAYSVLVTMPHTKKPGWCARTFSS